MNGFFSKLFSLLYQSQMHNDLLDFNLYGVVGIIMLIAVALFTCIYYFGMNHARFAYKLYWFIIMLVCELVVFLVAFLYPKRTLSFEGVEYPTSEYLFFGFTVCLYTAIFFFIFSLLIKNFSLQLKKIPF